MRIVFFGSPEFAVPILRAIAAEPHFEVPLIVTQAAKGASPVEVAANNLGLPVYRPVTLRDPQSRAPLAEAQPDLFVVAAFGLIFGRRTLDIPRLGSVNVHPSLLPRFRGASPVMGAIACGDETTGVSLMEMDTGLDTGAVFSMKRVVVASDDTTESLTARLAEVGASQAVRDIPRWVSGELTAVPQATIGASLTRPLTKADGLIDWRRPAREIERHVRAMWPWPRAWTTIDGSPIQIHQARVVEACSGRAPGSIITARRRIVVACGDDALELLIVEPAGRRAMSAAAYLNGRRSPIEQFGEGVEGDFASRPPLIVPVPASLAKLGGQDIYCG